MFVAAAEEDDHLAGDKAGLEAEAELGKRWRYGVKGRYTNGGKRQNDRHKMRVQRNIDDWRRDRDRYRD